MAATSPIQPAMKHQDLRNRIKQFALAGIRFVGNLLRDNPACVRGYRLLRSAFK
jgi:hypothetical protein